MMMQLMGFSDFGSTKGKNHGGASASTEFVKVPQKRQYRQYMNRKGGTGVQDRTAG